MAASYKILLVDDEDMVRSVIRTMLETFGYVVVEAANGQQGLERFAAEKPDLVFTDLQMPQLDGLGFISCLKEISPETPIIVISGTGNVQSAVDAIRLGAWDYVTKPVEALECLDIAAQRVLERARLISENKAYQEHLEDIVIKRTQELHDSEVRYRTLFETANDAIIMLQEDQIISCNLKACELFGCRESSMIGHSLLEFSPPVQLTGENSSVAMQHRLQSAIEGRVQFYEWQHQKDSGVLFDAEISLNRLELHGFHYLQAIMRDITERKKAQVALLDNARIKRELEIAQEIQQSLLPDRPPQLPGVCVGCHCIPAASVGGDYYDFFPVSNTALDVVIADVAGHSFGAGLMMTELRSVLHATVGDNTSPGRLLGLVNDLLYNDLSRAELQISMFYMRLDTAQGKLVYANAGHCRPLLFRKKDGCIEELDAEGMLMGVQNDLPFDECCTVVEDGDIVLLYTDGIPEAENAVGEFFGLERMKEVVEPCQHLPPQAIIDSLCLTLQGFMRSRAVSDDVTVVVLKIQSES